MKKTPSLSLLAAATVLLFKPAFPQPAAWQTQGSGPRFRKADFFWYDPKLDPSASFVLQSAAFWRAGALSCQVLLDEKNPEAFPRIAKQTYIYSLRFGKPHADFGFIVPAEGLDATDFSEQETDWTHYSMKYESAGKTGDKKTFFSLTWNRLSPGVLVQANVSELTFFHDAAWQPAFLAVGGGGERPAAEIVRAEFADKAPLEQLDSCGAWLLVWAGANSSLTSTHEPMLEQVPLNARDPNRKPGDLPLQFKADCPFLFVFKNAPLRCEFTGNGLQFSFLDIDGGAGAVVAAPLLGEKWLPADETAVWEQKGLSEEIRSRCASLVRLLGRYPITVEEVHAYDSTSDETRITYRFQFAEIQAGAEPCAPVPPMLSIAANAGFPVKFSEQVVDFDYPTSYGTLHAAPGAESYTWRVRGLSRYVRDRREAAGPASAPARLEQELEKALAEIVEAGHMAPWHCYPALRKAGGMFLTLRDLTWAMPGETLYYLAECLPLARDQKLKEKIKSYLKTERAAYPPERIALVPPDEGARRERYRIPENWVERVKGKYREMNKKPYSEMNFYAQRNLIPWMNIYGLSRYYYALPEEQAEINSVWPAVKPLLEPYLCQSDWASLGWFDWELTPQSYNHYGWHGLGGSADANSALAGAMGYARLAELAGDAEAAALGYAQIAKSAALRIGLEKLPAYYYSNGFIKIPADPQWQVKRATSSHAPLYVWSWTGPQDDPRRIHQMNECGVYLIDLHSRFGLAAVNRGLVPEAGALLAPYIAGETRDWLRAVSAHMGDWFRIYNEPYGCLGVHSGAVSGYGTGDGWNFAPPEDQYQLFLAHALLAGTPAEELVRYIDLPYMRAGDYYYLHKLALSVRALRERKE